MYLFFSFLRTRFFCNSLAVLELAFVSSKLAFCKFPRVSDSQSAENESVCYRIWCNLKLLDKVHVHWTQMHAKVEWDLLAIGGKRSLDKEFGYRKRGR